MTNSQEKPDLLAIATHRRENMARGEKMLWLRLKKLNQQGWHFRRTHPLAKYIADFYLAKAALVIEVDGDKNDLPPREEAERQRYFEYRHLQVLRFSEAEVLRDCAAVEKRIIAAAQQTINTWVAQLKPAAVSLPRREPEIEIPFPTEAPSLTLSNQLSEELQAAYRSKDSARLQNHATELLIQMLGTGVKFRPGQWEAIETVAIRRERALVVQRTGWGKSLVYFLTTRLLRDQGTGPTLLISPLLSLMRNQSAMAARIGICAQTINSTNRDDWSDVESALEKGTCDLLLISPERLNNEHFLKQVLPRIAGRIGLFVVDEAHCISDWGHDFRPDYRRIVRVLQNLPKGVPVLGTTATANDRVVADIQTQLGPGLSVLRGSLVRESLRLQNITLANQCERLAWLVENVPMLVEQTGSGIIYCLTVADTKRVTNWLKLKLPQIRCEAYHAGEDDRIDRPGLEQSFINNEIQILVATVALGMGFDKPDIGFVIHYQRPGSVVAYYQQVGRAGRAVERSYGILLNGPEDDEISEFFISSAFPSLESQLAILQVLEESSGLTLSELLARVNISRTMLDKALRQLEVDGAISSNYENRKVVYFRTPNPWKPDLERIERITTLRRAELAQMQAYVKHTGCLMAFLQTALDDPTAKPCKRCAICRNKGLPTQVSPELAREAEDFLLDNIIPIDPHRQWPGGLFGPGKAIIEPEHRNAPGRSLCYYGDGWGKMVQRGKYQDGLFSDELVKAALEMICQHWKPNPFPEWVTAIPSRRHPQLVPGLAQRIAHGLGLPFLPSLVRSGDAQEQKTMQNSSMQARNVQGTLAVIGVIPTSPVLLVDDIIDSGWTLAMAGYLLRIKGSGLVYPFTLAKATARTLR